MRITDFDREDADIDWFATDSNGHILHVASGGGILPESVAASQEVLLELHQYFLTRPETEVAEVTTAAEEVSSYQSFARYARRGLFSFEKNRLHEPTDTRYYLIARPLRLLLLHELPAPLAELLGRTQLPGSVAQQTTLDVSAIR